MKRELTIFDDSKSCRTQRKHDLHLSQEDLFTPHVINDDTGTELFYQ